MTWVDSALIATVVSALITIGSWVVAHWSSNRIDEKRRIEKIVDIETALEAEIRSNLLRFEATDLDRHLDEIVSKMRASAGFTPFVPRYASIVIFEAIVGEITILPNRTIEDVVLYYKLEYKLRDLVEDLRSEKFAALEGERKIEIYGDYVWLIKSARGQGQSALTALASAKQAESYA